MRDGQCPRLLVGHTAGCRRRRHPCSAGAMWQRGKARSGRRDQGVASHADWPSVFYFAAPQVPHCASRRRLARPRTVVQASRRTRLKGRFQHERNREYKHSGKCKSRNQIPAPLCYQRRVAYQACCERLIGPDGVQVSVFALDPPLELPHANEALCSTMGPMCLHLEHPVPPTFVSAPFFPHLSMVGRPRHHRCLRHARPCCSYAPALG